LLEIKSKVLVLGDNLHVRQKKLLLFLVVVIAAFVLSGCGVSHDGADITTTAPDGLWQTLVVWPLAKALLWLDTWLASWGIRYHWGWAIILFTVIVKLVTFPLTLSQMRGMQAQKELQPKIQELQKKYGKDRDKISQEQMKLYKEAGVNPLSGCLPLVIQMPVLFGLYAALVVIGPELANAAFYWIPDLGFPTYSQGMGWITEAFNSGDWYTLIAYLILPVLLMISQFVMQKWMTPPVPTSPDTSDNPMGGMTKQLTYMMTFMFGFFTLQVPAGLTLYWVTSNALQMLQQWAITNNRLGLGKPAAKLTVATAAVGSNGNTTVAVLPDSKRSDSNGASSTAVTIDGEATTVETTDGDTTSPDKAKEARRRKAKRR
jgi:YidC/Oxa1 family membrane protein insertase